MADVRLTAELFVDGRVPRTPALSPDGKWVTYVVRDELWLASTDGTVNRRLRKLDGPGGKPDLPGRHVVEVAQQPGGGPAAVLSWATPISDPAPVLHVSGEEQTAAPGAHSLTWWRGDDGWHLAYLGKTGLVGGNTVFDVSPAGGEHRNLTAGMRFCPTDLAADGDGELLMLVADGLDTAIHRLDGEVARIDGHAKDLTAGGGMVAMVMSSAYEPPNVYAGPPAGPFRRLTDLRPELTGVRWGRQERLSYRAADGLALDGLLIGPLMGEPPCPLVTIVHGGPYDRHADRLDLGWAFPGQWLAAAGYAVFLPNPRGGLGHGHDFAARVAGAAGHADWPDVEAGIDVLVARGVADPDRLGIAGWSHGGFMAAWAIGRTDRFRAAVMGAGISDWELLAATGEEGPFEAALGGRASSPIVYASRIRTPVLILHGERDTNVPLSQATRFRQALRVEHELVVYPGEGHRLREREHRIDVLHRTRDWLDRWLTPRRRRW